jgi:hypothetical protein
MKRTKLKRLQEFPEELRYEISTLYNLGIESYEVEYLLSRKKY